MIALFLKELRGFFSALMGYVVVVVFLLLLGLFLWVFPGERNILDAGQASLEVLFSWSPWIFMFLIPAVTMRSFAEEHRTGTMELLLTRPLGEGQIVLAKYLGAVAVMLFALLPTLIYLPIIGELGQPQWNFDAGAIRGSYCGLLLLGAAYTAIGIMVSTWTDNPLVAFLITLLMLVFGFIGFTALGQFSWLGSWDLFFSQIGMETHYRAMSMGLLHGSDIMYFVVLIATCLWTARLALLWKRDQRRQDFIQWILGIGLAGVASFVMGLFPVQWDLTDEQRHTLTDSTQDLLRGLEDEVFVTCYLSGDYPAQWKRLERSIRFQVNEFSEAASGKMRFQFVNIYDSEDRQTIGQNEEKLFEQGLRFTRISSEQNGTKAFQTVWPGAIVTFKNRKETVQFFKSDIPEPTETMIQGSINSIEFELISAIRRLLREERPSIAMIEGHGELQAPEVADFVMELENDYDVFRVRLEGQVNVLSERLEGMAQRTNRFDLAIVAKPDSSFDPKDQVILDQFIMNGGKVLWLIDPIHANMDSLASSQFTMGTTKNLGIYDQLFQYGVRLNRNLVIDAQCAPIALGAGPMGNQRNIQMFNWYFAPVAIPQGIAHPITTNLDPIHFDFVSSLDTVGSDPMIRKTVLLKSSEMAREYKAPVRISSSIVDLTPDYFGDNAIANQPFAILLEGEFTSAFAHRLPDTLKQDVDFAFRDRSRKTAQIIVGDGDVIRNKVKDGPNGPMILPLGYDRYANRVVYDNKEFLTNAVSYLLDDVASISVRSRNIVLRPLHLERIRQERLGWQLIAVLLPLLFTMALGFLFTFLRRKRYA
jgi:ABC-2 type transport system permease protein